MKKHSLFGDDVSQEGTMPENDLRNLRSTKFQVTATGSIQDLDMEEALEEAFRKHGPNLPHMLRNL